MTVNAPNPSIKRDAALTRTALSHTLVHQFGYKNTLTTFSINQFSSAKSSTARQRVTSD